MIKKINLLILVLLVQVVTIAQTIRYVQSGGTGNGGSWTNASGDLQKMIQNSAKGDQVWVQKGTYSGRFMLKNAVEIYGGFKGDEKQLADRDFRNNETILDGDNIQRVIVASGCSSKTILDGFTISNGSDTSDDGGGGMYNVNSSTTINNCIFKNNFSEYYGGAIANESKKSKPVFTNCIIKANRSGKGAGVYNRLSSPTFIGCIFSGNKTLNTQFHGHGGAMYNYYDAKVNIVNCVFSKNIGGTGGAIYSYDCIIKVYNSIFFENKKTYFEDEIDTKVAGNDIENQKDYSPCEVIIENSLLQNPKSVYQKYSKNGCLHTLNAEITTAESDRNLYGTSSLIPGFKSNSFMLKDCSKLINAGMSVSGITMPQKDIAGNKRIIGASIDIGAYENNASLLATDLYPVNMATNVAVDSNIQITFEKEITKNVGHIVIYDDTDNIFQKISVDDVVISGKVVSINLAKSFDNNRKYYIKIDNKAFKNGECNYYGGIEGKSIWTFTTEESKKSNEITFVDITKTYGDANFDLKATSDYPGEISYEIIPGGTGSATLFGANNRSVNLGSVGTVKIKATIASTNSYNVSSKEITLTIRKKALTLNGLVVGDKVYDGTTTIKLISKGNLSGIVANDELIINDIIANYSDKNVGGNKSIIVSDIILSGPDAGNYFIINPLGITAGITGKILEIDGLNAEDKIYDGNKNAVLSGVAGLKGVVENDDVYVKGIPVGSFEDEKIGFGKKIAITGFSLSGTDKANYILAQLELSASIKESNPSGKKDQSITWNQDLILGCDGISTLTLKANCNSGLPIVYTSSEPAIGLITNDKLEMKKRGVITITASVKGNEVYKPAKAIIKKVVFKLDGLVQQDWDDTLSFDNISKEYVKYQWYKNGQLIPNMTKQYYTEENLNGEYYLEVTDNKGDVYETCPVQFNMVSYKESFKLYSNPVSRDSYFYVEPDFFSSDLAKAKISVYDIYGKLIEVVDDVKQKNKLKSPNTSGVYVVLLEFANGKRESKNLLVK